MSASTTTATASGIELVDDGVVETPGLELDDWNTMGECEYPLSPAPSSTASADGAADVEALWDRESGYVHSFFVYTRYVR